MEYVNDGKCNVVRLVGWTRKVAFHDAMVSPTGIFQQMLSTQCLSGFSGRVLFALMLLSSFFTYSFPSCLAVYYLPLISWWSRKKKTVKIKLLSLNWYLSTGQKGTLKHQKLTLIYERPKISEHVQRKTNPKTIRQKELPKKCSKILFLNTRLLWYVRS